MGKDYKIFDNIEIGIAVYEAINDGQDFIIVDFNPHAYKITNSIGKDIIGKSVYEIFPGIKKMGLQAVFMSVLKTGIAQKHHSKFYEDNNLKTFFENYIYRINSKHIVVVFQDVLNQVKEKENLEQKILEIEKINKMMVQRELKMIELKNEIRDLKKLV